MLKKIQVKNSVFYVKNVKTQMKKCWKNNQEKNPCASIFENFWVFYKANVYVLACVCVCVCERVFVLMAIINRIFNVETLTLKNFNGH